MATREEKRATAIAALAELPTYAEDVVLIRTAIREIALTGQSVAYGGRSLSMANLKDLTDLLALYEAKAAVEVQACPGRNRISYLTPIT